MFVILLVFFPSVVLSGVVCRRPFFSTSTLYSQDEVFCNLYVLMISGTVLFLMAALIELNEAKRCMWIVYILKTHSGSQFLYIRIAGTSCWIFIFYHARLLVTYLLLLSQDFTSSVYNVTLRKPVAYNCFEKYSDSMCHSVSNKYIALDTIRPPLPLSRQGGSRN